MVRRSAPSLLLLVACTRPNGAFDEPTAGESTAASTSAAATTTRPTSGEASGPPDPTTTAAGQTGTGTTSPVVTTDATTSTAADATTTSTTTTGDTTTTTDATGSTSGSTTDDCLLPCGECFSCVDGQCVADPPETPCDAPVGPPCEQTIHSEVDDGVIVSCHANAAVPAACNGQGICRYPCGPIGEVIVACDKVCKLAIDACIPGGAVATVTPGTMCHTDQPSPGCQAVCEVDPGGSTYTQQACDPTGACVAAMPEACGLFKCNALGCLKMCFNESQCVDAASCSMNVCK